MVTLENARLSHLTLSDLLDVVVTLVARTIMELVKNYYRISSNTS